MFELTAPAVVLIVLLVWILLVVALVFFWKKFAKKGTLTVVFRTTLVLLSNIVAVLLAFLLLNNQYEFYTSWQELLSDISTGGLANSSKAAVTPVFETFTAGAQPEQTLDAKTQIPKLPPLSNEAKIKPSPNIVGKDRTFVYTVTGSQSRITTQVTVVLPKNYEQKDITHPVLLVIHGIPGTPEGVLNQMSVEKGINDAVSAGELVDPIVVAPKTTTNSSYDNECADLPNLKMEAFLAVDLPAWLVGNFKVSSLKSAWSTMGVSEGGWCSAMLTMLHPEQFGTALIFGGYFQALWPTSIKVPAAVNKRYDLLTLARNQAPPVALWAQSPQTDKVAYPAITEFVRSVRAPLSLTAVILQDGGHRSSVWSPYLPQALKWLGQVAPGFDPAAKTP